MKKFIILFMIIHIFSYANYLISNSEIVLFYDKSYNSVHYMRGDVFQGIDISRIEGKLILDGEKVISVNKYFESANLIPQTNILKLNYNIDGKYLTVNIIPSMIEKDKLYFVVEFVNFLKDNRKVDFAFRIAPQYDNKYVEYNESKDSYGYDRFYFKSENYKGETYITRDSVIEELMLEKVEGKIKKYQDDNMYYIIHNVDYNKPIEFVVKFYRDFEDSAKIEEYYKNNITTPKLSPIKIESRIVCLNIIYKIVKIYDFKEHTISDGFDVSSVSNALKIHNMYGGYYWRSFSEYIIYHNDEVEEYYNNSNKIDVHKLSWNYVCLDDDRNIIKVYDNDSLRSENIYKRNITESIKSNSKFKGYIWMNINDVINLIPDKLEEYYKQQEQK